MMRISASLLLATALLAAAPLAAQDAAPAARGVRPQGFGDRWEKQVPVIASGAWSGPRTPDGQPDISGFYSNTISNHSNFTDPQAGPPGEHPAAAKLPRDQRAPSRVSDPPDGQIPYLPAARRRPHARPPVR